MPFTAQQEAERLRGKTDLMFLGTEVLGMDFQEVPHRELFRCFLQCDPSKNLSDLDTQIKKRMILWPRGLFKTSAVRVAIVQLLLNYPDCRILIGVATQKLGTPQLEAVKRVFENPTEKFRELYPEYCGSNLGNKSTFNLPNRKDFTLPEYNVTTSTGSSVKAGSHYDFVFIDDLVNDQNYQNADVLEGCWQEFLAFGPLRDPGGFLFVTGTPYTFGDTYERIEEGAVAEMKKLNSTVWKISKNTCWIEFCQTCDKPDTWHEEKKVICEFKPSGRKQVLFPQTESKRGRTIGHTVEFLESEKLEKGEEFFGCQYECRRISRGLQAFTEELIDRQTLYHFERPIMEDEKDRIVRDVQALTLKGIKFDDALAQVVRRTGKGEIPLGGWEFVVGDLAYISLKESSQKKRDNGVFYVVRVANGALYFHHCYRGRWKSGEVGKMICFLTIKHKPKLFFIEGFNGWEAYDTVIEMVAVKEGIENLPPIEWLPMSNQEDAKLIRIGSIHGWLEQKKCYFFGGMDHYEELKQNLLKWPKLGRRDDHGDCVGIGCNAPHGVALERIPRVGSTLNFVQARMYPNGLPFERGSEDVRQDSYPAGPCGSGIIC